MCINKIIKNLPIKLMKNGFVRKYTPFIKKTPSHASKQTLTPSVVRNEYGIPFVSEEYKKGEGK